ncbi:MAG: hypothetical protein VKJ64_03825 [Leptolyngbyaceae bacterium]|nr:hypothetical protein [Leptolyngbyaceae bacterium]
MDKAVQSPPILAHLGTIRLSAPYLKNILLNMGDAIAPLMLLNCSRGKPQYRF